MLVVNKPAGMLVQGDRTGDISLLDLVKDFIREAYKKPGNVFLGLVHRLDRPASGVLILARTSKGLARMNEVFRERKIEKEYWAIVETPPPKKRDHLVHWLKKDRKKNKVSVLDAEHPDAQRAALTYEVFLEADDNYLLKVFPTTGRPHQIRAQLAHIGSPIRGDVKYGFNSPNPDGNICLHAHAVQFLHPVKKEQICITAPVPGSGLWPKFESLIN